MDGWTIGFIIGGAVVLIVVIVLVLMILGARRVLSHGGRALANLEQARDNTQGLWQVHETNLTAVRIVDGARAARESLQGGPDA